MRWLTRIFSVLLVAAVLACGAVSCSSAGSVRKDKHRKERVTKRKRADRKKQEKEMQREYVKDAHLHGDRKKLVEEAITWLGTPYKYAGQEKGVCTDCSGFVMQVYLTELDLKLPRNSAKQAEFCKTLKQKDVQPGDLVFFATGKEEGRVTHVGMMLDDVSFIHASSSKGVVVSRMDNPWYATRFVKYGRVPQMK